MRKITRVDDALHEYQVAHRTPDDAILTELRRETEEKTGSLAGTTRFLRFPREPHGLREPRHQRTRLVEDLKWMEQYVRGVEWKDEGPVMDKKEKAKEKETKEAATGQ